MTLTCRRSLPCSSASAVQSFCEYHLEGKSGASRCDFFLRFISHHVSPERGPLCFNDTTSLWSVVLLSLFYQHTNQLLYFHTKMWQNTKAPENTMAWRVQPRRFSEHGRILIKKLHFYTKMWQNTQKQLKIDSSQGPNTMAWRVQPRRFSSMSGVKTLRLNPL